MSEGLARTAERLARTGPFKASVFGTIVVGPIAVSKPKWIAVQLIALTKRRVATAGWVMIFKWMFARVSSALPTTRSVMICAKSK